MSMAATMGGRKTAAPGRAPARAAARPPFSLDRVWDNAWTMRLRGLIAAGVGGALVVALATYDPADPSLNASSGRAPTNALDWPGALAADLMVQTIGFAGFAAALLMVALGLRRASAGDPLETRGNLRWRAVAGAMAVIVGAGALAVLAPPALWPVATGLGGRVGDGLLNLVDLAARALGFAPERTIAAAVFGVAALPLFLWGLGLGGADLSAVATWRPRRRERPVAPERDDDALFVAAPALKPAREKAPMFRRPQPEPKAAEAPAAIDDDDDADVPLAEPVGPLEVKAPKATLKESGREARESQAAFEFAQDGGFRLPELAMLSKPKPRSADFDEEALKQNARMLEGVLAEFGVKGAIDQIRPGPVVTLYELVPAAGVKSARVIALSDDIARSMSARACRVSVVPGRNAIGIELPNPNRETVYLRDLLSSSEYERSSVNLPVALGETIGGEPYVADLTKMPHLLVAGTTGSGKSVGVNAMILSILYRLPPDKCRFIMIDPKMLELSVYDGIPHLLAPVVTDPKKAVVALKWTVREMEDRYRRMSKIGVRNIGGYNDKAHEALAAGEHFERTVQTGFNEQGRPTYETEKIRPEPMPYLVVVMDEMADLMLVAGKDVEGAVQRLAQMARAAGIHLIMATQRPSVDVITGTIKANFPTRISFQVTSKIDSRTILGEQGGEQLLGQGDMLYMAGGGRITRLHGPFVSDEEVETVAKFLRDQGEPQYVEDVTEGPDDEDEDVAASSAGLSEADGADLYDQAVAVVTRDRKASTSYVQRRLQIGYNRAASLIERMEKEGVVGAANHAGKREILVKGPPEV